MRPLEETWCDSDRRIRSIAVIPADDPAAVIAYNKSGNQDHPTHDWRVIKVSGQEKASRKALVGLNKEPLAALNECRIYYDFYSIQIRVFRCDDKTDVAPSSAKQAERPGKVAEPKVYSALSDSYSSTKSDRLGNSLRI